MLAGRLLRPWQPWCRCGRFVATAIALSRHPVLCVQQGALRKDLQEAQFIGLSMDEASGNGHTAWLSIHVYFLKEGVRYGHAHTTTVYVRA